MKRFSVSFGMAIGCLVAVTTFFSGVARAEPGLLLAAQANDPYPVIPDPEFATPPGGARVEKTLEGGGEEISLLRSNGKRYGHRVADSLGRPLVTEFYDSEGNAYLHIISTYSGGEAADEATEQALAKVRLPIAALYQPIGDTGKRRAVTPFANLINHITCGSDYWWHDNFMWEGAMHWRWGSSSTPSYLNQTNTLTSLRNARSEWESNINWCSYADYATINFTYDGTTTAGYGDNGINTVGWGGMAGTSCGSSAIGCTRWEGAFPDDIVEADTRLSNSATWINGKASLKYDVQSVFAHETGHALAFRDIDYDCTVLMCGSVYTNDTSGRKLGQGDAIGNNASS